MIKYFKLINWAKTFLDTFLTQLLSKRAMAYWLVCFTLDPRVVDKSPVGITMFVIMFAFGQDACSRLLLATHGAVIDPGAAAIGEKS